MTHDKKNEEQTRKKLDVPQSKSRRNFLIRAGALVGIGIMGYGTFYKLTRPPTFVEAYNNPLLRERWLESLQTRQYVKKQILSHDHILELKKKALNFDENAWAFTYPVEQELMMGKMSPSILYVNPAQTFRRLPSKEDIKLEPLGKILENVIENHELCHADHFYKGIPGYDTKLFEAINQNLSRLLYSAVSEIVCHRMEYDGLEKLTSKDPIINNYKGNMYKLTIPHLMMILEISKSSNNKKLIDMVKKELWFKVKEFE